MGDALPSVSADNRQVSTRRRVVSFTSLINVWSSQPHMQPRTCVVDIYVGPRMQYTVVRWRLMQGYGIKVVVQAESVSFLS